MIPGAGGGGSEAAILVSCTEVHHKVGKGFVGFGFGSPVAARNFEKAGGMDEIVPEADDGGRGWRVVTGGGETDAVVELGEEFVDRSGRIPRRSHAQGVGIEFDLGDGSPGIPEMGEDLEAGDAAKTEFGIG